MQSMNDLPGILLWTIAVFFSILIHELGHAFVAQRYGATPIIHLHGMGGFMAHNASLNRKQSIAVGAAGPGASLALGIATVLFIGMIPPDTPGGKLFSTYMIYINFFWTFINLLPILPLDGGQIARDVLGPSRSEITRWIGVFFAGAIAIWAFNIGQVFLGLMLAYLGFMNYQQQPRGPMA
jgi:Zn-dependent protease